MRILAPAFLCVAVTMAWAGKPWHDLPWTEWKEAAAKELLTDSAWASRWTFGANNLGVRGGMIVGSRPSVTVQWLSALPLRMAQARLLRQQDHLLPKSTLEGFIHDPLYTYNYVIGIVPPSDPDYEKPFLAGLGNLDPDQHMNQIYLITKSGRKIYIHDYRKPEPQTGFAALLLFPRNDENGHPHLSLEDQEVSVYLNIVLDMGSNWPARGRLRGSVQADARLKQKFRLKKMVFRGQLSL